MSAEPTLEEADDRMLMRRHVAGDPDAFGEIFRRHRDRMWSVAIGVCGDHEMAAEAVQEGFVSAFRRAGSYRAEAAVTTWLHRIVVNACIDQTRRARPVAELTDQHAARLRTPDPTGSVDTRLLLHEALGELPEPQRAALVLVDMHAVPVAEAAQILDVPVGTVKSRCARGRQALSEVLHRAGVEIPGTSGRAAASDMGGNHQAKGGER